MTALLFSCADGRITAALDELQRRLDIANADRLLLPGGPLVLTRPGMERRVAMEGIKAQVEAHGIKRIVLVSHQECAAYDRALGGLGFDQQELLERDLRRVKMLLENDFPEVEVSCYVIPWRENGAGGAAFADAETVE
jgi:hypothetical protein